MKPQIKYDTSKADELGNALFAAVLSGIAYKSQPEAEAELAEVGYRDTKVLFFRTSLLSAVVIEWGEVLAVAFKGSSTWREWLNNLNFWPRRTPYGIVHAGFAHAIEKFGPYLYKAILPGLLSGSKVVLTGHCRGGTLATLFSFFLALNSHRVHAVYTFGAPNFGDAEFVSHFGGKSPPPPTRQRPQLLLYLCVWYGTLRLLLKAFMHYLMRRIGRKLMRALSD
jgi:hypothetical protein